MKMRHVLFLTLIFGVVDLYAQCNNDSEPDAPTMVEIGVTYAKLIWDHQADTHSHIVQFGDGVNFFDATNAQYSSEWSHRAATVTSLAPGTWYAIRIRMENECWDQDGTRYAYDSHSDVRWFLTVPSVVALNGQACTATSSSITFAWDQLQNQTVSGYFLDVSTNRNFTPYVRQNIDVVGGGTTSYTVTNLNPGTNYYYQVRAYNATAASDWQPQATVPEIPTRTLKPTDPVNSEVKPTSFKASWTAPAGVLHEYRMDVSTNQNFTAPLVVSHLKVVGTSVTIDGIAQGTQALATATRYYYRVRAINNSGASENMNGEVLTAPATPTLDVSSITSSSFRLDWFAPPTATEYDIFVARDQAFNDPVTGYNPKVVTTVTETVGGLSHSTAYYVKFRARNAPAAASEVVTKTIVTLAQGTNQMEFVNLTFPQEHATGVQQKLTVKVERGNNPTVKLFHKKNSEPVSEYKSQTVAITGDKYELPVNDAWLDEFGMEFYFEARDATAQVVRTDVAMIKAKVAEVELPALAFGATSKDYHIISIPYTFNQALVRDVFERAMGTYDKSKWRLVQYRNGQNFDFSDGLGAENIKQGAGYWFITKNEKQLSFADGITYGNAVSEPFTLSLKTGWNQIGNPFPFHVNWSDVLDDNGNPAGVGDLIVFDQQFKESDFLKVFGGGFVFADQNTEIEFKVTLPKATEDGFSGGRIASDDVNQNDYTAGWMLPIDLTQGDKVNHFCGVGMHFQAAEGKDDFDRITIPRFASYLEFNTNHDDYPFDFSRSIVPLQSEYTWSFKIESNSHEPVKLEWSKQHVSELGAQVILYDETKRVVLDMSKIDRHETVSLANIRIFFTTKERCDVVYTELGQPYPNPFHQELTIPYDYAWEGYSTVHVAILDVSGKQIWEKTFYEEANKNVQEIKWNGETRDGNQAASGMYVYQVLVTNGSKKFTLNGKIIKN